MNCYLEKGKNNHGFTIVELLVVIVIIGILAAITIVSYTGITSKASIASLQSDLTNASTQLKLYNTLYGSYPTTFNASFCPTAPNNDTNYCLKSSNGTTYTYKVSPTNSNIFCLQSTKDTNSYNITQEGQLLAGPCPVLNLDAGNIASYPGTGTTWKDLSGNDNNGALNGGVTYSSSNGGALSFDGVSGYVDAGNSSILNVSGSLTIGLWTRINSFPVTSETNLVQKNGYSQYRVGLTPGGLLHTTIQVTDGINSTFVDEYGNDFYPNLNTFYYIVYVFDSSNSSASLYVNGNLYGSKSSIYNQIVTSSSNVLIGSYPGYKFFNGLLSNVKVYNKALIASDVLQNFNATKGRYGL